MQQGDGTGDRSGAWNPYEPVEPGAPAAGGAGGATTPTTSTVAEPYAGYSASQDASPYATSQDASPFVASPYPAGAPAPQGTDGVSIAALITGILGMGLIPLVLGIVGVSRTGRTGRPGKGLAIAGIVLGGLSMIGWAIVVVLAMAVGALGSSGALDSVRSEISQGVAQSYGDDETLDGLYDSCADGDDYACDTLYWESAPGSEYEAFGLSCGGRLEQCMIEIG